MPNVCIFGVYKPKGITSHDVIYRVRHACGIQRVGHAGTLDPLASGVLVVAVGRQSTKLLDTIVQKEKEYVARIFLGAWSKTDDAEGEKTQVKNPLQPEISDIKNVLKKCSGTILLEPPQFSAIKIKGVPAYKKARKGKRVELAPRPSLIKQISLVSYAWPILTIKVITGPGVYVRSLARHIGTFLKTGAYVADLERTRVGNFTKSECVSLEDLSERDFSSCTDGQ